MERDPLPRQLIRVRERQVKKNKRIVYEHVYQDGSVVVHMVLNTAVLMAGGAEWHGAPAYCAGCHDLRAHIYYADDTCRCLVCDNEYGTNDNRPFAKVLRSPYAK